MRLSRARHSTTAAAAAVAVALAALTLTSSWSSAATEATSATGATGATEATSATDVALAPLVAAWPASYVVTGTKAEPLYTERIRVERLGDTFTLRIEALSQGNAALGTQHSTVRVSESGAVIWQSGCTKDAEACADDTTLRGFLTTALLVAQGRAGTLPATGTSRDFFGASVVCIDDTALHPNDPPVVRLDPCVDPRTGAVLAHWSEDSHAFVGATLARGYRIASPALLSPAPSPSLTPGL